MMGIKVYDVTPGDEVGAAAVFDGDKTVYFWEGKTKEGLAEEINKQIKELEK